MAGRASAKTARSASETGPLLSIVASSRDTVEARAEIDDQSLDERGAVSEAVLLDLVSRTIRHSITAAAENAHPVTLEEYSAHLYPQGTGGWLVVHASLLQGGPDKMTWQAVIHRVESPAEARRETVIGAYMQSFRRATAAEAKPAGTAAVTEDAPSPERNGQSTIDERREQLVQAACNVISRKGYAATTMRDIALSSGLPISTMYQYIKSKDDLLFMITNSCMTELFEYFERHLPTQGSASEKMKNAIAKYVQYVSKNRKYINLVYRETKSLSRANRDKILSLERRLLSSWEKIIIDGKKAGEFTVDHTFLAANLIYFSCTMWALRHWIINESSEQDVVEMLWRFSLRGLK